VLLRYAAAYGLLEVRGRNRKWPLLFTAMTGRYEV
jgi:hypothetical protein